MYYIMFMFKCKVLNITTSKQYFKQTNEVPTHLRSIRKIMEKKDMQKWVLGVSGAFNQYININFIYFSKEIKMSFYFKSIIKLNGNQGDISKCISDIQSINIKEKTWKNLGIDLEIVENIFYPIEILDSNSIQLNTEKTPSEDLFEKICEKYGLHGGLKYRSLSWAEIGEFEISLDGKKLWKVLHDFDFEFIEIIKVVNEKLIGRPEEYDATVEKLSRELLETMHWGPWPKYLTKNERTILFLSTFGLAIWDGHKRSINVEL